MDLTYLWRGPLVSTEVIVLHTEAFAEEGGCERLHVDFEDDLAPFYLDACGFAPAAGLLGL